MTGDTTSNTITIIKEPNTSVDAFSGAQMRLAAGLSPDSLGGGSLSAPDPATGREVLLLSKKGEGRLPLYLTY